MLSCLLMLSLWSGIASPYFKKGSLKGLKKLSSNKDNRDLKETSSNTYNNEFLKAAKLNSRLVDEMKWEFGGTPQQGLSIYLPIINQLIGNPSAASSPEFAVALAQWQQQNALESSGILNEACWKKMVELLQSKRLKERSYPPEDTLITVSSSEFYDPERPEDLRKVYTEAYQAYRMMIKEALKDDAVAKAMADIHDQESQKYFKIISAWRSREYQEELRKRQKGNLGRVALAINSPHFTGRALDIYVGGQPVDTNNKNRAQQIASPAYQWLVQNASRFGFRPYFYEPWHWEYVGSRLDK